MVVNETQTSITTDKPGRVFESSRRASGVGRLPGPLGFFIALAMLLAPRLAADVLRTQSIQLRAGWNAVFLEVDPVNADPASVFAGLPVDVATTFAQEAKAVYFPRDPAEHPWQEEGWSVWYAPARPDAFLSTLNAVRGQRAYLVKVSADAKWTVSGKVVGRSIQWAPDSFTLTGFSVEPDSPPTFAKLLAGASAHRGQRVFRLVNGLWTLVRDHAQTPVRSGEAYWIFSKGASDFQGPIRVKPLVGDKLAFGDTSNGLRLELANADSAAAYILMQKIPIAEPLALSYEHRDLSSLATSYPALPDTYALPPLPPAARSSIRLYVRREQMTSPNQSALLKVSNLDGFVVWVPVEANRGGK